MKVVAFILCTAIAAVCGLEPIASADDASAGVSNRDRVFANYTREAATVGAGVLRVELRGLHSEDQSDPDLDVLGFPIERIERKEGAAVLSATGGVIDLLGSYGLGNNAEVGFDVPGVLQQFQIDGKGGLTEQDIGDVSLYLKVKYKVVDRCHVGGGLDLSLPTGPERKYAGTGELGVNPFVSTRYEYGHIAVGAHIGYYLYTGNVKDVLNYSGQVIIRANSMFSLRTEISGRHFKQYGDTFDDVLVYPGVDIDFFDWLTVRPTGIFNITAQSQDWGIGLGVAARFQLF